MDAQGRPLVPTKIEHIYDGLIPEPYRTMWELGHYKEQLNVLKIVDLIPVSSVRLAGGAKPMREVLAMVQKTVPDEKNADITWVDKMKVRRTQNGSREQAGLDYIKEGSQNLDMQTRRILHALARYNRFANGGWDVDAAYLSTWAYEPIFSHYAADPHHEHASEFTYLPQRYRRTVYSMVPCMHLRTLIIRRSVGKIF